MRYMSVMKKLLPDNSKLLGKKISGIELTKRAIVFAFVNKLEGEEAEVLREEGKDLIKILNIS